MSYKINYTWNEETGIAIYTMKDMETNTTVIGKAQCHPDDKSKMSKYLGLEIAELRAKISVLRNIRDVEVKPQLKILKHLYTNMTTNKQYNPRSYEARMVRRQYKLQQQRLEDIKNTIQDCQEYLSRLIH